MFSFRQAGALLVTAVLIIMGTGMVSSSPETLAAHQPRDVTHVDVTPPGVTLTDVTLTDVTHTVESPSGAIRLALSVEAGVPRYAVSFRGAEIIEPSALGYDSLNSGSFNDNIRVVDVERREHHSTWTPVAGTNDAIDDHYNELAVTLRQTGGEEDVPRTLRVVARAYNDGIAFQYVIPPDEASGTGSTPERAHPLTIYREGTEFNFGGDREAFIFRRPPKGFYGRPSGGENSSYEGVFRPDSLGALAPDDIVALPLLVNAEDAWVVVSEADLTEYAGMYLQRPTDAPTDPGVVQSLLHREYKLTGLSKNYTGIGPTDWAVKTERPMRSPWRVIMIADTPGQLAESNLIATLNDPSILEDTSWIKPDLAIWPWWNGRYTEDPSIPNDTLSVPFLKRYVDFAAESDVPYLLIDLGWDEIDIEEVMQYAESQEVDVFLWVEEMALREGRLDSTFQAFRDLGAVGVKVDFIFPDQQSNIAFLHEILQSAGRHRLMVNVHGVHKPTGIWRTYPHFLTREGVLALEFSRKHEKPTPEHNVTLPFTRGLLGPMDYTPGVFDLDGPPGISRKVQTTRMQQMAMYIVYFSALQMIPDYPQSYRNFPEAWDVIRRVPTTWDETRVLEGAPADYVVTARRKGDRWYVGAMTDEQARTFDVSLDFLAPNTTYQAQVFQDSEAIEHDHLGIDVREATVVQKDTVSLSLAETGGGVIVLSPR